MSILRCSLWVNKQEKAQVWIWLVSSMMHRSLNPFPITIIIIIIIVVVIIIVMLSKKHGTFQKSGHTFGVIGCTSAAMLMPTLAVMLMSAFKIRYKKSYKKMMIFDPIYQIGYIFKFHTKNEKCFCKFSAVFSLTFHFCDLSTLKFDLKTAIFLKRKVMEARFRLQTPLFIFLVYHSFFQFCGSSGLP